eukprot:15458973-Alexandrium_andersonii.AAC.1
MPVATPLNAMGQALPRMAPAALLRGTPKPARTSRASLARCMRLAVRPIPLDLATRLRERI